MGSVLLESLKNLQRERGETSPFESHLEFLRWSDQVAPLLSFDPKLHSAFKRTVTSADVSYKLGSVLDATGSINHAIGLVNQAITSLEVAAFQVPTQTFATEVVFPKHVEPELPSKLTIKWLYEHAPLSFYFWLLGLLCAAFLAGVAFSETPMFSALKGSHQAKATVPGKAD